jgi:hypothetical protein
VKEKWLNDRKAELLPCPYFHNVFTLPHDLNPLILINMEVMPELLFAAAKETLQAFAERQNFILLVNRLWNKQWITYSKQPFGGPEQVLEYLGRYTHRVAITNNRILSIEKGQVTFSYRDRADGNEVKTMSLKAKEFIRRFLLHILPKGFMKIRYFGFLAHTNKKASIALLRQLINPDAKIAQKLTETVQEMMLRLTGIDIFLCPQCGKGKMVYMGPLPEPFLDTS